MDIFFGGRSIDRKVKVDDTPAIDALNNLNKYYRSISIVQMQELEKTQKRSIMILATIFIITIMLAFIISNSISKSMINSIKSLMQIATRVSKGDFSIAKKEMPLLSDDEFDTLGKQMITMGQELNYVFNKLNDSNKTLEQFAFVAAHDLQEPIKKISSFSDLLKLEMDSKMTPEGEIYLEKIKNCSIRMIELTKALLNYSQLKYNIHENDKVDLNLILNEVKDNLELQIKESKAQITINQMPIVLGDKQLLIVLFQQFLSNAMKFRKKDNPLTITIDAEKINDLSYLIKIKDNGIGFDMKYKDTVLRPFGRLHSKDKFPGTGIGLATCQSILKTLQSELIIESEINVGTTFSFKLKFIQ